MPVDGLELAFDGELLKLLDLDLSEHARRIVLVERRNEPLQAVADMKCEVRRGPVGQGANVVDRDAVTGGGQFGVLELAHRFKCMTLLRASG